MSHPAPAVSRPKVAQEDHQEFPSRTVRRWGRRVLTCAVAVVVLWLVGSAVVKLVTTQLWFDSVRDGSVYSTMLGAQILLFCVFAIPAGLVGGFTIRAVRRSRPRLPVSEQDQTTRWLFRKHEPQLWRPILLLAV